MEGQVVTHDSRTKTRSLPSRLRALVRRDSAARRRTTFGKIARRLRPFVRAGMGMRLGSWSVRMLVVSCALAPAMAHARTPLPTLEVVPPAKKRVRLLDVRWAAQVGYGYSLGRRAPVLALGHEALTRFVAKAPLRKTHECVFAVLALESEPIDPRL